MRASPYATGVPTKRGLFSANDRKLCGRREGGRSFCARYAQTSRRGLARQLNYLALMVSPAPRWDGLSDASVLLADMKRYVRFGLADEAALRLLAPAAIPHAEAIIEEFYVRLSEHEEARRTLDSSERIERHR